MDNLVPIHADGDGHCLVHAVSRALIGWELFWHPLRVNLKQHLQDNIEKYKMQFGVINLASCFLLNYIYH